MIWLPGLQDTEIAPGLLIRCSELGIKVNRKTKCFVVHHGDTEQRYGYTFAHAESPYAAFQKAEAEHAVLQALKAECKKLNHSMCSKRLKEKNVKGTSRLNLGEKRDMLVEALWKEVLKEKRVLKKKEGSTQASQQVPEPHPDGILRTSSSSNGSNGSNTAAQNDTPDGASSNNGSNDKKRVLAPNSIEPGTNESPGKKQKAKHAKQNMSNKKSASLSMNGDGADEPKKGAGKQEGTHKKTEKLFDLPGAELPSKGTVEDVTESMFQPKTDDMAAADFPQPSNSETELILPRIALIKFAEAARIIKAEYAACTRGFVAGRKITQGRAYRGKFFVEHLFASDPAFGDDVNQREYRAWMDKIDQQAVLGRLASWLNK